MDVELNTDYTAGFSAEMLSAKVAQLFLMVFFIMVVLMNHLIICLVSSSTVRGCFCSKTLVLLPPSVCVLELLQTLK